MNNIPAWPAWPAWARRTATTADWDATKEAYQQGRLQIGWPETAALRSWAKHQGWPTPFFGFEDAFIATMFKTNENFALAIQQSGMTMQIPQKQYTLPRERIQQFDAWYEQRSSSGHPQQWGMLVEALREIRRAIEAGIVVTIEGEQEGEQSLQNWQQFYSWAHGRYHMLEDGYDKWIGDDS